MKRENDLPHRIVEQENIWIPMSDGISLAARLWLPEDAQFRPVPAVLEYIPYRKRDMTAVRDGATHSYLAGHGYACIRLDVRGCGDSEGIYGDQFTSRYVDDGLEAIAWIARQPWCNGSVAAFGLSWGGAIALQIAARQPPALKTIVCAAGIDDRYQLRYPGGCLATATLTSIVAQMSYATRPPDPAIVGPRWREMWLARLEAVSPMTEVWLGHPLRDAVWRAASIAEDYGRITCPAMLSAGWADPAFSDAMLRTLAGLDVPRRGIFGAWAHRYPHVGVPGPAIGYLQETLRWLDRWLKGVATNAPEAPQFVAWLPGGFTVAPTPETRPGRWIAEASWPSATVVQTDWWLGRDGLTRTPQADHREEFRSSILVGRAAGEAMPIFTTGNNPELPGDQREDDGLSVVFDSPPLAAAIEILGSPVLSLRLDGRMDGQIVVRLCEIAPDGRSRRVAWGARNLALSDDLSAPRRPATGAETVTVSLHAIADTLARGSRIRVALSRSYWPILWPSAGTGKVWLEAASSRLTLPVRPASQGDCPPPPAPETVVSIVSQSLRAGRYRREEAIYPTTGELVISLTDDMGEVRLVGIDLAMSEVTARIFRIQPDGTGAMVETETSCRFRRGDWSAETTVRGRVAAEGSSLTCDHAIDAREAGRVVFDRRWTSRKNG